MQKANAQHTQMQNQSAPRQSKGAALESPQAEKIAQLEAMVESSQQAGKLAQLAAMVDSSPAMAAQRNFAGQVHNSAAMIAQREAVNGIAQREEALATPNNTGLPDNLKSGIESLSGMSMDNVKVHYNSSQPAQLNALAYAQGTDIHVAPGQEQHLPHEAWHVVQQAQGRVKPTMQMKDRVPVNDDESLENEADVMGGRAIAGGVAQGRSIESESIDPNFEPTKPPAGVAQLALVDDLESGRVATAIAGETHDEIPQQLERKRWSHVDVTVMYEHDALPVSGKRPDPPILRVASAWTMLQALARDFWAAVSSNEDMRNAPGVLEEQRTLARFIKNDLEDLGLGVDERLVKAFNQMDALCKGLPKDEVALMELPRQSQQYLAETKLSMLGGIDSLIQSIHRAGSFADVDFDEESLRIGRSREMLNNINAAKPTRTVYKVGDLHVDDMKRLKMKHDPSVAVLSKHEYLPEFADADVDPASQGKAVFNSIRNDML